MSTGACGINCSICRLYLQGECSSCGPAMSETAQMKIKAQEQLLGAPCPFLACARLNRMNHCLGDCDSFPCENFEQGPYPYSTGFLSMQRRRRKEMQEKRSKKEETKPSREHWDLLCSRQPKEVARAASVKWEGDKVAFKILNKHIEISPSRRQMDFVDKDIREEASGPVSLLAITYLFYAEGAPLSGQWVTEKDLSCALFFQGIHELQLDPLLEHFGTVPDLFLQTAEKIGGSKTNDGGDASVLFWVLPMVPVKLIFWQQDEELPASITVLFDRSIEKFLPADGILAMVSLLQQEILLEAER
jgi:hypothetical protein